MGNIGIISINTFDMLRIVFECSGNRKTDGMLLRRTKAILDSFYGADPYQFQIIETARSYVLEFPGDRTHDCSLLRESLMSVNLSVGQKPLERPGWVYLVEDHAGLYKIGQTRNLNRRLWEDISPKLPYPLTLVMAFSSSKYMQFESDLHRRFASQRLNGEWFELSKSDLADFYNFAMVHGDEVKEEWTDEDSDGPIYSKTDQGSSHVQGEDGRLNTLT